MPLCKYGKLKSPTKRRKCKKAPRGKAARASYAYTPKTLGRGRWRRRR